MTESKDLESGEIKDLLQDVNIKIEEDNTLQGASQGDTANTDDMKDSSTLMSKTQADSD